MKAMMAIPKQNATGKEVSQKAKDALLNATRNTNEEHDPDQAWYRTKKWQAAEREAGEDDSEEQAKIFETMEEFIATLDDNDEPDD